MWETWVWSLGREDPLEKEMATHSSTLAWRITRTEEPGGLQSMGSKRVRHDWATSLTQCSPLLPCAWKDRESQEKAKRKPICRGQDYLGRERDEGWLLAAKFAPHDLAFDHSWLDPRGSGSKSGQLVLPPGISPWLELYLPSEGIARGLTGLVSVDGGLQVSAGVISLQPFIPALDWGTHQSS